VELSLAAILHLILALCAAETLESGMGFQPMVTGKMPVPLRNPGLIALALVAVTAIAMSMLQVGGRYGFPLTWIFLALAAIWAVADSWQFTGRDAALRRPSAPPASEQHSALSLLTSGYSSPSRLPHCLRHIFVFRQTAVCPNTILAGAHQTNAARSCSSLLEHLSAG